MAEISSEEHEKSEVGRGMPTNLSDGTITDDYTFDCLHFVQKLQRCWEEWGSR